MPVKQQSEIVEELGREAMAFRAFRDMHGHDPFYKEKMDNWWTSLMERFDRLIPLATPQSHPAGVFSEPVSYAENHD